MFFKNKQFPEGRIQIFLVQKQQQQQWKQQQQEN